MRFHTSVTERGDFRSCRRRWDLGVNKCLVHKSRVPWNLIFGEAIHKGLEAYYKNNNRQVARAKAAFTRQWKVELSNLMDVYGTLFGHGIEDEWQMYQDKGIQMLTYYDFYDQKFPFWDDVLEVNIEERAFVDILDLDGERLPGLPLLSGRIDLVVKKDKGIWIVDHKTAANAYQARALDVDDQLTGYAYVYWRLSGEVPRGVIYNALIKEPPRPPKVLNSGELSKDKSQRTTYDLYLTAIKENGLERADYTEMLEFLFDKGWSQFFLRDAMERNIEELESFEKRLRYEYTDMVRAIEDPAYMYPNPSQSNCSWCGYVAICQAMEEQGDVEYVIEEGYEVIPPRIQIPKRVLSEKWEGV